jgi:hypothetical protein
VRELTLSLIRKDRLKLRSLFELVLGDSCESGHEGELERLVMSRLSIGESVNDPLSESHGVAG